MKKFLLSNAALMALFACLTGLFSCSSDSSSSTSTIDSIKVVSNIINGPLGDYFEVVEKNYKATIDESVVRINIEIKRVAEGGPTKVDYGGPTLILELLDEDDNVIASEDTDDYYGHERLESALSLREGQSSSIHFDISGDKENFPNIKKIKVSSKWDESKENESDQEATTSSHDDISASTDASSDDSEDYASSSARSSRGSTDFDEWLTEYENYVNKYISLLKKAKAGDMEAMSEYASMMESAQELSSKIGNVSSDLTASQVARYQRINNKLMKAAQELN